MLFAAIAGSVGFLCFMLIPLLRSHPVFPCASLAVVAAAISLFSATSYVFEPAVALCGNGRLVSAVLTEAPQPVGDGYVCMLKCKTVDGKDFNGKMRMKSFEIPDAELYDTLSFTANIYPLGGTDADSLNYYRSTGVFIGSYPTDTVRVIPRSRISPGYIIESVRTEAYNRLRNVLKLDSGAFAGAICFGIKSGFPASVRRDFNASGTGHLIAVSGTHIAIIGFFVLAFLKALRLPKVWASLMTFAAVWFYVLLTGAEIPAVRSGIMMSVLLFGNIIHREQDALNTLGFSALLIAVANPFAVYSWSFLLSFSSILGLAVLRPALCAPCFRLIAKVPNVFLQKPLRSFCSLLCSSLAVSAAMLPADILFIGAHSLVSPLANLAVLWSVSPIIILGILTAVFSTTFFGLAAGFLCGLLCRYQLSVAKFFAGFELAYVETGQKYMQLWFGCALILCAAVLLLNIRKKLVFRLLTLVLCCTLACGVGSYMLFNRSTVKLTVCDVGNGSAFVLTKGRQAAVFACGGEKASYTVQKALDNCFTLRLKLLAVPDFDSTESAGAAGVMLSYPPEILLSPKVNFLKNITDGSCEALYPERYTEKLWDGVHIDYSCADGCEFAYITANNCKILLLFTPATDISRMPAEYLTADILVCRSQPPAKLSPEGFGLVAVSAANENWRAFAGSNSIFTAGNGNVCISIPDTKTYKIERM